MRGKWASWVNLILGAWLIAAPFMLYSGVGSALGNDIVVGVLVVIFALVAIASRAAWASWINVALGVWEIIAPFALGYSGTTAAVTNDIIVGVAFIVFGLISALSARSAAVGTAGTGVRSDERGYGNAYGGDRGRLDDTETTEEEQRRRNRRAA